MGDKNHYTATQVAQALTEARGMVYIAARKLKCSHSTVYNYIARYPKVRHAKEKAEGELLDIAELKVYEAIQRGEVWALLFLLKTKGRNRGYVERSELTGAEGKPIPIKYIEVSDIDDNTD